MLYYDGTFKTCPSISVFLPFFISQKSMSDSVPVSGLFFIGKLAGIEKKGKTKTMSDENWFFWFTVAMILIAILGLGALFLAPRSPDVVYISGEVLRTSPPDVMIEGYEWVQIQSKWIPTHFWVDVKDIPPEGYYQISASPVGSIWSIEPLSSADISLLEISPLPTS